MIRLTFVYAACLLLAGCLRPGADVERVSEMDLDPDAGPALEAIAAPQPDGPNVIGDLLAEARPDATEPDEDTVAEAAPSPRRGLGRFLPFGRSAAAEAESDGSGQGLNVAQADAATTLESPLADPAGGSVEVAESGDVSGEEAVATPILRADDSLDQLVQSDEPQPQRRGLFARLRGNSNGTEGAEPEVTQVAAAAVPAIPVVPVAEPKETETRVAARRTTLLGALRRGGGPTEPGPGQDGVAFGTVLPYGTMATICGVKPALMGEQVASYPEHGPRYRIYDSAPGTLSLRTHYITGFKDGCARQFTAALALFGAPGGHEATRYERSHRHIDMTRTDREYEALRARMCQAPVGSSCPERRFSRFEKSTVFVSVYERFGTNPRWADMLIHDGRVVAKDLKGD
ncbi:MAG: hypothetical protein AAGH17_08370 [Pseudomonadota bacterium]